jgi:hypothetical protein
VESFLVDGGNPLYAGGNWLGRVKSMETGTRALLGTWPEVRQRDWRRTPDGDGNPADDCAREAAGTISGSVRHGYRDGSSDFIGTPDLAYVQERMEIEITKA